jgi:hypothetical protein
MLQRPIDPATKFTTDFLSVFSCKIRYSMLAEAKKKKFSSLPSLPTEGENTTRFPSCWTVKDKGQ